MCIFTNQGMRIIRQSTQQAMGIRRRRMHWVIRCSLQGYHRIIWEGINKDRAYSRMEDRAEKANLTIVWLRRMRAHPPHDIMTLRSLWDPTFQKTSISEKNKKAPEDRHEKWVWNGRRNVACGTPIPHIILVRSHSRRETLQERIDRRRTFSHISSNLQPEVREGNM